MRDDYCDGLGDRLPNCPTATLSNAVAVDHDEEAVSTWPPRVAFVLLSRNEAHVVNAEVVKPSEKVQ